MLVAKPIDPLASHQLSDSKYCRRISATAASLSNPEETPDFSPECHHSIPIFYIPPLLSSLPDGFAHTSVPSLETPPLSTETRLPDIDSASLALHNALHSFRPITEAYATTPYIEAFNWSDLQLPLDEEREWYCVAFRSNRKASSDSSPLYEADRLAHEEAIHNGGLLMYWYGVPDSAGFNLATCIWQSRRHAIAAASRPLHAVAMRLAAASYDVYNLERYVLRKQPGETGVTIEEYSGGDVGW